MTTATREGRGALKEVRLDLDGMTCASCVSRIERKLNKLDGVEATVNFATEQATIHCDESVRVDDLVSAVEGAGYHAHPADDSGAHHRYDESAAVLRRRLVVAVALTAPLAALAMVPALHFAGWEWVALALATPVVFWSGAGFHRAALQSARHLAATMDTLISIGTLAAYLWSAVVLVGGIEADTYFEVAAVITTLILLGRYLEARAKRRSSEAIRMLLELGAKDARILRDGNELSVPIEQLVPGDLMVVRPGEKIPTDGIVVEGESALDRVAAHRRVGARRGRTGRRRRRSDDQHVRPARRACDEGGRGHGAGADRAARRDRAVGEGSGATAGRPRLGRVRPGRDRDLARDARRVVAARRLRRGGVHGRGGGADHRVPVCARAGDTHGADGRYRSGCSARHRHQGPGDPRADPQDRHDRARQDRHDHRRPHGAGRGHAARRRAASGDPAPRRRGRGRVRASDRPSCRRGRPARDRGAASGDRFPKRPGDGRPRHRRRTRDRGRPARTGRSPSRGTGRRARRWSCATP